MPIPHKACRLLIGALLLVACSVASKGAHAQQRVGVLGVEGAQVDARVRAAVGRALVASVDPRLGWEALDVTNVPAQQTLALIGCSTISSACLDDLAESLGVDTLLFGTASASASRYTLALTHYVARDGIHFAQSIPFSSSPEDGELSTTVAAMLAGLGVIDIDADGPASASFDGIDAGPVPVRVAGVTPGEHRVVVAFADGRDAERSIWVEGARYSALYLTPSGRPPRVGRASPGRRAAGWTLVASAAGSASAATVFALRASDTQARYDVATTERLSTELADQGARQTRTANALYVTGAALATTGVVVLVTGHRRATLAASAEPLRGGAMVRAALTF